MKNASLHHLFNFHFVKHFSHHYSSLKVGIRKTHDKLCNKMEIPNKILIFIYFLYVRLFLLMTINIFCLIEMRFFFFSFFFYSFFFVCLWMRKQGTKKRALSNFLSHVLCSCNNGKFSIWLWRKKKRKEMIDAHIKFCIILFNIVAKSLYFQILNYYLIKRGKLLLDHGKVEEKEKEKNIRFG